MGMTRFLLKKKKKSVAIGMKVVSLKRDKQRFQLLQPVGWALKMVHMVDPLFPATSTSTVTREITRK